MPSQPQLIDLSCPADATHTAPTGISVTKPLARHKRPVTGRQHELLQAGPHRHPGLVFHGLCDFLWEAASFEVRCFYHSRLAELC